MASRNKIFSPKLYTQIENYIRFASVDQSWSKSKQYNFKKKYRVSYEFSNNQLWFNDSKDGLRKEIITENNIDEILTNLYNNPRTTATSRD